MTTETTNNTTEVAGLIAMLPKEQQALILELVVGLLPDDVATPSDLACIAKAREEYARGEVIWREF